MSSKRAAASGLPIGARAVAGGAAFRVWAPDRRRVSVVLSDSEREFELAAEPGGYFAGESGEAQVGSLYSFRLDDDAQLYPDPASRFQPDGPFGPSEIVDPAAYRWSDQAWRGVAPEGLVAYEMHVGAFTPEGTWEAAARQLPELAALGVNVIELMPVADFPGRFGWGYDGVNLFAPTRLYGRPDDFRRFVDQAHTHGLGVILDVVCNHLGPSGNFLKAFAKAYFTDRYETEWGEPINFDGEGSGPVRAFYLANAARWIAEYHLDGLRFDATQSMFDEARGGRHILSELTQAARAAADGRTIWLAAENEPQAARLACPIQAGGHGFDAVWNDDFHHSAMVALTGRADAYYSDYRGAPQEFISAAKYGFLFQGQRYEWQDKPRGEPAFDLAPQNFVAYLQNHDQVANSATGLRGAQLSAPAQWRAMTALLLLGPWTPMLFMGQEFGASAPFCFFADHEPELARLVRRGRAGFLAQFPNLADPALQARLPPPHEPATFARCRLDFAERERHAPAYRLHKDLLALRRATELIRAARPGGFDGAVLGPAAFLLRYFSGAEDDRLLLVNLGRDLPLDPAPEPLLAPHEGASWRVLWHSEDPAYGGIGVGPVYGEQNWRLPAQCALLLAPERAS